MPPNGEETDWSACEINGETITHELERGRNATASLVQNLRAGFVPPEPANRTSWYSAIAAGVSGRLRATGRPSFATTRLLGRHTTGGPLHRDAHQGLGTIDSLRCCPLGPLFAVGVDRLRRAFGTFWNVTVGWRACNLLKKWWPETGLNRRCRPFQGRLAMELSGLESADMIETTSVAASPI